jgi:flagellar hook-associated protein 1 FlgK
MSAALNIAARALTTNLDALKVVGNNIANVNTEGYSRQNVLLRTSGYQEFGNGFFGKGVEIATITRNHDAYLTREATAAKSAASADGMRLSKLKQLEDLFPTGPTGLGASMNNMLNAWNDVASSPSNPTARVVVIARGDEFAARLRTTGAQLDEQQLGTELQVEATVTAVNRLAQDLATVNQRILETRGSPNTPNDLFDQRDQLLSDLNQYVRTSNVPGEGGTVSVFVGGSQPLVLGQTANQLEFAKGNSPRELKFVQGGASTPMDYKQLGGGELAGLMTYLREDLDAMRGQVDTLAWTLATEVNKQHKLGRDLDGGPGSDFFVPPSQPPSSIEGTAKNLQMALTSPDKLAAASPVRVEAGGGNSSGLSIESLSAIRSVGSPVSTVTLTFLANGTFTATGLDPLDLSNPLPDNPAPPATVASYNFAPGEPIKFNGWSLTLRGNPSATDTFTIDAAPASFARQNAGNAGAILALRDKMFDGVPLGDGYVSVISSLGTKVQSAKFAAEFTSQVATSTESARSGMAGVNLDEEAARLLQFQQSYQASAKFLQIAQSTFDTLLQTMGR